MALTRRTVDVSWRLSNFVLGWGGPATGEIPLLQQIENSSARVPPLLQIPNEMWEQPVTEGSRTHVLRCYLGARSHEQLVENTNCLITLPCRGQCSLTIGINR